MTIDERHSSFVIRPSSSQICLLTLPLLEDVYYRAKAFNRQTRSGEEQCSRSETYLNSARCP